MILQILTLPNAFDIGIDQQEPVVELKAQVLVDRLLENVARHPQVVMIADIGPGNRSQLLQGWVEAIEKWPIKYRQNALILLRELIKAGRIGRIATSEADISAIIQRATTLEPELIVIPEPSSSSQTLLSIEEQTRTEVSPPSGLNQTKFWRRKVKASSWSLVPGEPARERVRDEVLVPLARHSAKFHVYDKYLGISAYDCLYRKTDRDKIEEFLKAVSKSQNPTPLFESSEDVTGEFRLYLEASETLFAAADQLGDGKQRRVVFHTQLFNFRNREKLDSQVLRATGLNLHLWSLRETNKYRSVEVDIVVPTEHDAHDRYLVTDQLTVALGRGLSLWNERGEAREVNLMRLGSTAGIEKYFAPKLKRLTEAELRNPAFKCAQLIGK